MVAAPRLSVVVPVFATEAYLRECLSSIARQDVDFELIVVNDGSTDGCQRIIDEFRDSDPRVRSVEQVHAGPGVARNRGLELARGDFVAFVDSDDRVPSGAYRCLLEAAERTRADVCTGLNQSFRERKSWLNPQMRELTQSCASWATLSELPLLARDASPCNKVFSRDLIAREGLRFPVGIELREDLHFVFRAYAAAQRITVIPSVVYHYRARPPHEAPSLTMAIDAKKIRDLIWVANDLEEGYGKGLSTPVLAQLRRGLIGNIAFRLPGALALESAAPVELAEAVQAFLRKNDAGWISSLDDHFQRLVAQLVFDGALERAVATAKAGPEGLGALEWSTASEAAVTAAATLRKDVDDRLRGLLDQRARRALRGVKKATSLWPVARSRIRRRTGHLAREATLAVARARSTASGGLFRGQRVWLVGERRGDSVEDTGYHFFRYLRREHPQLPAYFITKRRAKGFSRLNGLGNVLEMGSVEAYEALLAARVLVYSDCRRDLFYSAPRAGQFIRPDVVGCFLQHGIIGLQRMGDFYNRDEMLARGERIDVFVTSSEREKQLVCESLGFPSHEVVVTGLSRHDELSTSRPRGRTILVTPTWRQWLRYDGAESVGRSQYFVAWQTLLGDRRLNRLLVEHDATLRFCPHFAMAVQAQLFRPCSERIKILDPGATNLQDEIRRAAAVITDYSSVSFEFAYMFRPAIYYQFDANQFAAARGAPLLSGDEIAGPILSSQDGVVSAVRELLASNFALAEPYRSRAERLFASRDGRHCERIYRAILRAQSQGTGGAASSRRESQFYSGDRLP